MMDDSYQASKYVREAFAKVLDRITDRILPENANQLASWQTKYIATGAGLFAWCAYGFRHGVENVKKTPIQTEISSKTFSELPVYWTDLLWVPLALIAISMWVCIAKSFTRGQPLTFFFWGLILPTIALNILRFAFR